MGGNFLGKYPPSAKVKHRPLDLALHAAFPAAIRRLASQERQAVASGRARVCAAPSPNIGCDGEQARTEGSTSRRRTARRHRDVAGGLRFRRSCFRAAGSACDHDSSRRPRYRNLRRRRRVVPACPHHRQSDPARHRLVVGRDGHLSLHAQPDVPGSVPGAGGMGHLSNAVAFAGPLLFALYINRFQIVPEERALAAKFGTAFDDYRSRTRRWI